MASTDAPIRVLGVDPERNFAGGESQVLGLALELSRLGHSAELACDPAGTLWERARTQRVRCHPLKIRNAMDFRAGLRLRRLLAERRYHVVHFHTSRALAVAPFARGRGAALVVTRRMDYPPNRYFAPLLYNRAVDAVAAISESVAQALASAGVERARITLIPSGVDCDRFRPPTTAERDGARHSLGLRPDDLVVGAVGMLEPRKGHRYLIEAIAQLRGQLDERRRPRLLIAGSGSQLEALRAQVRGLRADAAVTMLGMVEDPLPVLWVSDIFALPSLKEGLGVSLLEAMATGVAPVAARAGGAAGAIEDGRSGLLVEPGNALELALALKRLIEDLALRAALGVTARTRVMERFSMAAMAERTLELYRMCLSRNTVGKGNQCAA